ncbi:hypothetical protein T492DRAFT_1115134 [Pavlovales sp. CCMP2436]|nr:hypothetical protein T492DRAFT_1115134 [Pavlovales sp. CCMP2436]
MSRLWRRGKRTQHARSSRELGPIALSGRRRAPFLRLTSSTSLAWRARRATWGTTQRGSKSKGGTKHATQLAARDRRASLEPVVHFEPIMAPPEPDEAPADMAFTDECAPASAPRAEGDAPALAPPSEPGPTTEEQRDVRRKELNAAAQRLSRALCKERLAEEAVAATVELAAARSQAGVHAVRDKQGRARQDGTSDKPKFVLIHKAQHDSAKFRAMLLEIVRDPASGRSDSR